ncbi:hypothetical protein ACHHYP_06694 [Achlya hypogyna]|uniref:Uncharacterized protein n=1 Tax=Achlya hypogyna TaxID=1202772 RepID=A0A1V9YS77_ACHHY|nr:hypothetical protein ACHHYP_06694 [Achlya hypogyna]
MTSTPLEVSKQKSLSYTVLVLVCIVVVLVFLRQLLMLWNFATGWAKQNDDEYSGVPTAHEHDWESSGANYSISLQGTDSNPRSNPRSNPLYDTGDDVPNTIRLVPSTHPARV